MKRLLVVVALVCAAACVGPKVQPYTLTAPSVMAVPTPTPPAPSPIAQLTVSLSVGPSSPRKHRLATFEAITTGLRGQGSYTWAFGDGTTTATTTNLARHTYLDDGRVTASVHVTEESGRSATASVSVTIRDELDPPAQAPVPPVPPPALVGVLTCTPRVARTDTPCNVTVSYSGSVLRSGLVTDVDWDWGDGTTTKDSTEPTATHIYAQTGSYTVFARVTATTTDGPKTATVSRLLVVP